MLLAFTSSVALTFPRFTPPSFAIRRQSVSPSFLQIAPPSRCVTTFLSSSGSSDEIDELATDLKDVKRKIKAVEHLLKGDKLNDKHVSTPPDIVEYLPIYKYGNETMLLSLLGDLQKEKNGLQEEKNLLLKQKPAPISMAAGESKGMLRMTCCLKT